MKLETFLYPFLVILDKVLPLVAAQVILDKDGSMLMWTLEWTSHGAPMKTSQEVPPGCTKTYPWMWKIICRHKKCRFSR